ncbi:MAG: glucose-6-phosphate isomerase, partial [Paracoccaceae bacterium]
MIMVWDQLARHHNRIKDRRILDLFDDAGDGDAGDGDARAGEFSVRIGDMLFDYSKTNIDQTGRKLLLSLAENADVAGRRDAMFAGEKINETEGRAVLHTALRALDGGAVVVDGVDVMPGVRHTLERLEGFARGVRSTSLKPPGGGRFEDVVNISIGGSDLGPAMACLALAP